MRRGNYGAGSGGDSATTARLVLFAGLVAALAVLVGVFIGFLSDLRSGGDRVPSSSPALGGGSPDQSANQGAGGRGAVAGSQQIAPDAVRQRPDSDPLPGASQSDARGTGVTARPAAPVAAPAGLNRQPSPPLVLDCVSAFRANDALEDLRARYGAENVSIGPIELGEGFRETGVVVFAGDSLRRVELVWKDSVARQNPRMLWVRGDGEGQSRWQTADGISTGTDLRTIQRLNGRPFILAGFGWDYSGTVMSWSDGALERYNSSACDIRMRLSPAAGPDPSLAALYRQVTGSGEFPSSHAAMQALNPRVYELFTMFK